jgi:diguanylate cyclase (GGDEF)-like protein
MGLYAVGWTLLLAVVPLVLLLGLVIPPIAQECLEITVGLAVAAAGSLYLASSSSLFLGSFWLLGTAWLLFSLIVWDTGGLRSVAMVSLFVIVILSGAIRGWKWGAVAAVAGIATSFLLVWATANGSIPPSHVDWTPSTAGATFAAYFVALGALQAVMAFSSQRTIARIGAEQSERRAAEQRLLDVVDSAPFGSIVSDLGADGHLRVTHVNAAASALLGINAERLVGVGIGEAFRALSTDSALRAFEVIASSGGTHRIEAFPYMAQGRRGMLELNAFQIAPRSMAVLFTDVTERQREQTEMHRLAFHDELTNLPNRKLLLDRLDMALAGAQRNKTHVALLFVDLDDFKVINDRHGHAFGDELLVAVGARLRDGARRSDTVARFGGDEFTVLMPDVAGKDQVRTVAEKLVASARQPIEVAGRRVTITASIGIAVTGDIPMDANELLSRADAAMYQVKRAGRNGYRIN